MTIRPLPQNLVNQIAAGEVVERPASVVKELIENSLDAGARQVDVQIEAGGRRRICIADDGDGILPEELSLALASHATSKITQESDLLQVESFGFRGEALASIASVSHVTIRSRSRGSEAGAMCRCEGGVLGEVRPDARAVGTTIDVEHLFFNTPARRKFLKSDPTETAHVVEAVLRLALARTDVGFRLDTGTRRSLQLSPRTSLRERIAAGYGRELAASLIAVTAESTGCRLSGYLAPPAHARARSRLQQLYLNGRFVRDRSVQGAVRRAYSDFLAESLQPIYFLFLELDPRQVDFNVHPTKIEVRLRQSSDVYRFVLSAIDRSLQASDLTPRVRAPRAAFSSGAGGPAAAAVREPVTGGGFPPAGAPGPPPSAQQDLFEALFPPPETAVPAFASPPGREAAADPPPDSSVSRPPRMLPGRFVQVLRTYLVTACEEGMLILDQHALHERILYRQLRREWQAKSVPRQHLLTPLRVELAPADVDLLVESEGLLEDVGVSVAPFGDQEISVSAVPACLGPGDVPGLLRRLVTYLNEERPEGRLDDFADRMLFTMACHRAVRAGDPLNEAQIQALLQEADRVEHTHTCPHGRPTRVIVGAAELENFFKRRGF